MSEPGYWVSEGFIRRRSTGWASILQAVFARQLGLPSLPRAGFQVGLASLLLLAGAGSVRAATADTEAAALQLASAAAQLVQPPNAKRTAGDNAPMARIQVVATKGRPGGGGSIATSASMAAASVDKPWMRILLLSPSISDSTSVTMLGNEDLTLMRAFFVKPQTVIENGFSDDPMMGMTFDHFSGSTNVKLKTMSFAQHSAALQGAH